MLSKYKTDVRIQYPLNPTWCFHCLWSSKAHFIVLPPSCSHFIYCHAMPEYIFRKDQTFWQPVWWVWNALKVGVRAPWYLYSKEEKSVNSFFKKNPRAYFDMQSPRQKCHYYHYVSRRRAWGTTGFSLKEFKGC